MSFQLQPADLAACYSLSEIEAEIVKIKTAIDMARASKRDQFGDMQGDQSVTRQKLGDLLHELAIFLKAKNILNQADSSTADLISAEYTGRRTI